MTDCTGSAHVFIYIYECSTYMHADTHSQPLELSLALSDSFTHSLALSHHHSLTHVDNIITNKQTTITTHLCAHTVPAHRRRTHIYMHRALQMSDDNQSTHNVNSQ